MRTYLLMVFGMIFAAIVTYKLVPPDVPVSPPCPEPSQPAVARLYV